MSVPKSAVRHVGGPFLFLLHFRQVSDLFSCPPRRELERGTKGEIPHPRAATTRRKRKMKKRLTRGVAGWKEKQRGRISNGSFCLFEDAPSFFHPLSSPPAGDFSFFGTRTSFICLFQYALLTLHRPLAPVTELHFST